MSKKNAPVAVVIVNWNGGNFLPRCLAALAAQTLAPEKVIVVDNGSEDGSADGLERHYPGVVIVKLEKNLGFAAANNRGAQLARDSEWIALLNPDAFAAPDWLEKMLAGARAHPEFSFFGCRMLSDIDPAILDGVGDVYHRSGLVWREGHGKPAKGGHLAPKEIFSPCAAAALYQARAFLAVGGFDEDFFCYVEDVDLGFRLRLAGHRCLYLPEAMVKHAGSAITGRESDFSVYHGHRNLVWTYVKGMPAFWFWLYLPQHILLNMAALLWYSLRGRAAIILRSKWDALTGIPTMWRKRRDIQASRNCDPGNLTKLMAKGLSAFRR